jgi:hypothetical protein
VVPYHRLGPKVKTYHLLRYLAERHEVTGLVRPVSGRARPAALGHLRQRHHSAVAALATRDLWYLIRALATGRSFLIERDDSATMRRAIAGVLDRFAFDAVHADQISMAQFAVDLPVPLRVLDEHNAVWTIVRRSAESGRWGPQRLLAGWEWRRLRAYELDVCRRFDRVTVVSEVDATDLALTGSPERYQVVPIAVDTDVLPLPRTDGAGMS